MTLSAGACDLVCRCPGEGPGQPFCPSLGRSQHQGPGSPRNRALMNARKGSPSEPAWGAARRGWETRGHSGLGGRRARGRDRCTYLLLQLLVGPHEQLLVLHPRGALRRSTGHVPTHTAEPPWPRQSPGGGAPGRMAARTTSRVPNLEPREREAAGLWNTLLPAHVPKSVGTGVCISDRNSRAVTGPGRPADPSPAGSPRAGVPTAAPSSPGPDHGHPVSP